MNTNRFALVGALSLISILGCSRTTTADLQREEKIQKWFRNIACSGDLLSQFTPDAHSRDHLAMFDQIEPSLRETSISDDDLRYYAHSQPNILVPFVMETANQIHAQCPEKATKEKVRMFVGVVIGLGGADRERAKHRIQEAM